MSHVAPDADDGLKPRAEAEAGTEAAAEAPDGAEPVPPDVDLLTAGEVLPAARPLGVILAVPGFRTLWTGLALTTTAGWLGLAAQTSVAVRLAGTDYTRAVDGAAAVLVLRVLTPLLLGPPIASLVRRVDRKATLIGGEVLRAVLFATLPFVRHLWWLLVAVALLEVLACATASARDAATAVLVPRRRRDAADQARLLTSYGSAPVGAAAFALLVLLSALIGTGSHYIRDNPAELPLLVAAALCVGAAVTAYLLPAPSRDEGGANGARPWRLAALADGLRELRVRPVRGTVLGLVGLFAAGSAVVGLARPRVGDLGAGDPGYGLLATVLLLGPVPGMVLAPRVLPQVSRHRVFGLAVAAAGVVVILIAAIPDTAIVTVLAAALAVLGGIGWVTGRTVLTLERPDHQRARTDAFTQALLRVVLVVAVAVAGVVAGAVGRHSYQPTGHFLLVYDGTAWALLGVGVLTVLFGAFAFRLIDDRAGVPLRGDLAAALRGETRRAGRGTAAGYFIALEGGEGAGKSTQIAQLAEWIRSKGHEVVVTREPGATDLGRELRQLLLDHGTGPIHARTEAMLYAADRAEHVATVIRPALERGAIVLSDRYADSSVAYQGAGRDLAAADVARLSGWAADGLVPDLTVVLDIPPEVGLARSATPADRLEAEPVAFHERVRRGFLALAEADPERYLIVDATIEAAQVTRRIRGRLERELPLSEREQAEQQETVRRLRAEAEIRRQEEAAREAEKQALIARLKAEAEERRLEQEREAEAQRQRLEAERAAEEARMRLEAERARAEEERLRLEAERVRAQEAERLRREEEAARRAERRRIEVEEARRRAEAARLAEEEREQAEEERRRQAEEQQRAEETLRLAAEESEPADAGPAPTDGDTDAPDDRTHELPAMETEEDQTRVMPAVKERETVSPDETTTLIPALPDDVTQPIPPADLTRPLPPVPPQPGVAPPDSAPQDAVPQDTAPQDTPPQDTVPQDAVPRDTPPPKPKRRSLADDLLGPWPKE